MSRSFVSSLACALSAFAVAGCGQGPGPGDDTGEDGAGDATDSEGAECAIDVDCDDSDPCTVDTCDADFGECIHDPADADGDGYPAVSVAGAECGGTDCDDSNAAIHPDAPPDCTGVGDFDCDGPGDGDEDGDGHVTDECAAGDDCDDSDPGIFPGSADLGCAGEDRDCDGVDDADDDGDGGSSIACGGTDCDDSDPAVFWGALELECDGKDTNCDGMMTALEDADGDGSPGEGCAPAGTDPDCDDADDLSFPGAPEQCDEVDNDCDGSWADGGADDDGDGILDSACGGTDCDDADPGIGPGGPEVCDGALDEDCDGMVDEPDALLAPAAVTDTGLDQGSASAWSGSVHGVAWISTRDTYQEIYWRAVGPSGSLLGSEVKISASLASASQPAVAWTGSEFAIAWTDTRFGGNEIMLSLVGPGGSISAGEIRITSDPAVSQSPSLAWTGSEILVAWEDRRDGDGDIYLARLGGGGARASSDLRITSDPAGSASPEIAWSGSEIGLAWHDDRSGFFDFDVFFVRVAPDGTPVGSEVQIASGSSLQYAAAVAWVASAWAIAWQDGRDGNDEIYFQEVGADGVPSGPNVRVTSSAGISWMPVIAEAGARTAIAFMDNRSGSLQVWLAMVGPGGAEIRDEVAASAAPEMAGVPTLSWTGSAIGMTWTESEASSADIMFAVLGVCP